ncbi:MAG: type II toxin-antitoxin system RelB/DinJ family antitoxin [Candidatus Omnitrophica bacterium]|nr:type II toxin-antitoxin system RelB/DinJ family antitoxin [Alphaproteobacteria bacterium]MCK5493507.1 type II toxin-antitoxin system RelB/DinJ family antitoxin [Candidatus Omnitrophota bacterium]MCK5592162.1 type II toxin-antitoxin system RelB/DinJ family antitoxin [Candidatus Paceibacterota bacterium]
MITEPTNIRLETKAKAKAWQIFEALGMKPAQAFNLFIRQVNLQGGIPFEIKIPNAETIAAMEELANGGGERSKNTKEMFEKLGI